MGEYDFGAFLLEEVGYIYGGVFFCPKCVPAPIEDTYPILLMDVDEWSEGLECEECGDVILYSVDSQPPIM